MVLCRLLCHRVGGLNLPAPVSVNARCHAQYGASLSGRTLAAELGDSQLLRMLEAARVHAANIDSYAWLFAKYARGYSVVVANTLHSIFRSRHYRV